MYRVGIGYDIHRLKEGIPLILGGINIPNNAGLEGHSDADVLIHALMDAILGALGLPDIGVFFPDNDDRYKGASSLLLLKEVNMKLIENKYGIINADSVIIAQRPKLAGFIPDMKIKIAEVLKINKEDIGIKATTHEGLGPVGESKGIAAQAIVLLRKKD